MVLFITNLLRIYFHSFINCSHNTIFTLYTFCSKNNNKKNNYTFINSILVGLGADGKGTFGIHPAKSANDLLNIGWKYHVPVGRHSLVA